MERSPSGLLNLPEEIIYQILGFCDIKTLGRLCQTCKTMKVIIDSEEPWYKKAKFVLCSNLNSSSIQARSKPLLGMRKRCQVSRNWRKSHHKMSLIVTFPRCMPWLYLEQNSFFCSFGKIIMQFNRDSNGDIVQEKTRKLIPHSDDVSKFIINKEEIVSGGRDGKLGRWRKSSLQKINEFQAHNRDVFCVDAKEDIIISGSKDCSIKIWKAKAHETALVKHIDVGIRVLSLALMQLNKYVVVGLPGTNDIHPLQLYDLERAQSVTSFGQSFKRGAGILDIYPEYENTFLACGYDTTIQLWDIRCPKHCVSKWTDPYDNSIYSVKSDHNITVVSGANRHGIVHIWDKRWSKCQVIQYVREFNSPTYCVAFDAAHLFVAFDKAALQFSYM